MRVFGGRAASPALAAAIMAIGLTGEASAQQADHEIVVSIERVRALDKIDVVGQADFYARVVIDGEEFKTPAVRKADDLRPNWVIRKFVRPGTHAVRLEIDDRQVLTKDRIIDINRVNNKRHLDFRVNTRTCKVLDFSPTYNCRADIVRAGQEEKRAKVTFTVDVIKPRR